MHSAQSLRMVRVRVTCVWCWSADSMLPAAPPLCCCLLLPAAPSGTPEQGVRLAGVPCCAVELEQEIERLEAEAGRWAELWHSCTAWAGRVSPAGHSAAQAPPCIMRAGPVCCAQYSDSVHTRPLPAHCVTAVPHAAVCRDDELVNFSLAGAARDLPLSEHMSVDDVRNMQVAHMSGARFVQVAVNSWPAPLPPLRLTLSTLRLHCTCCVWWW